MINIHSSGVSNEGFRFLFHNIQALRGIFHLKVTPSKLQDFEFPFVPKKTWTLGVINVEFNSKSHDLETIFLYT